MPLAIEPIVEPFGLHVRPVTRDTLTDRKRHGDDAIAFGTVMHQVLERISLKELDPADPKAVIEVARRLFDAEGVGEASCRKHCDEVVRQRGLLGEAGLLDIVLPQPDS